MTMFTTGFGILKEKTHATVFILNQLWIQGGGKAKMS